MVSYIPGISASGALAPGLSAEAVRAVLELLSSAEIAAAYMPLADGATTAYVAGEITAALGLVAAQYQPLDSDLTAIAALSTTAFGRALLALADAAAARSAIGAAATSHTHAATEITTGTLDDARLSGNIPRLNAANTFTQTQTFSGTIIVGTGVSIVRNATGPTAETRAAGGLRVCNADGSALGPVACGSITANGSSAFAGSFAVNNQFNSILWNGAILGWSGSSGVSPTTANFAVTLSQASAGVLQIGTTANNASGSLNLSNLTASGNVQGTFRPTQFTVATLPSAAANTGRTVQVTDSSVDFPGNIGNTVAGGGAFNVDVKSNGTNWRITG